MKNNILFSIAFAFLLTACNQKDKNIESQNPEVTETTVETPITTVADSAVKISTKTSAVSSLDINSIVSEYLKLKNALANDSSKEAATAGKKLSAILNETNLSAFSPDEKNKYRTVFAAMDSNVKHISENADKLDHQRKYFALVSKDMTELIKTFGSNKKLYVDYCPMYDGGKSGYWISEIKEIKNPYFGSEMISCGGVVETLK